MNTERRLPRSPELMSRADTALLVVDVQERLVPVIPDHARIIWNCRRLIDGAKILGLPVAATEQYPQGLGGTVEELRERLGEAAPKMTFSCGGVPEIFEEWRSRGITKVLMCGIESHVCVQQTAFDLLADGFRMYLAADALGSRHSLDHEVAMHRLESAGAAVTTTEAALFEWAEVSGTPEFKQISALVREAPPG